MTGGVVLKSFIYNSALWEAADCVEWRWWWAFLVCQCRTCSCRRETSVKRYAVRGWCVVVSSEPAWIYAVYRYCTLDLVDCHWDSELHSPAFDFSTELSIRIPCSALHWPALGSTLLLSPAKNKQLNRNSVCKAIIVGLHYIYLYYWRKKHLIQCP